MTTPEVHPDRMVLRAGAGSERKHSAAGADAQGEAAAAPAAAPTADLAAAGVQAASVAAARISSSAAASAREEASGRESPVVFPAGWDPDEHALESTPAPRPMHEWPTGGEGGGSDAEGLDVLRPLPDFGNGDRADVAARRPVPHRIPELTVGTLVDSNRNLVVEQAMRAPAADFEC